MDRGGYSNYTSLWHLRDGKDEPRTFQTVFHKAVTLFLVLVCRGWVFHFCRVTRYKLYSNITNNRLLLQDTVMLAQFSHLILSVAALFQVLYPGPEGYWLEWFCSDARGFSEKQVQSGTNEFGPNLWNNVLSPLWSEIESFEFIATKDLYWHVKCWILFR